MSNPIDIGKAAYDAYCEQRNWFSFAGKTLPHFDQQSLDLQIAWTKAGLAARAVPSEPIYCYHSESLMGNIHVIRGYLNSLKEHRDVIHLESDGTSGIVVWRTLRT